MFINGQKVELMIIAIHALLAIYSAIAVFNVHIFFGGLFANWSSWWIYAILLFPFIVVAFMIWQMIRALSGRILRATCTKRGLNIQGLVENRLF